MQPIIITDRAAEEIKNKTKLQEGALGLRLTIKSTGCSGHSYYMEHVIRDDTGENGGEEAADDRFEQNGAVLFIPKIHSWMLFGMEIGYEESPLHTGFTFKNPNEAGRCGCGESFTVDRETLIAENEKTLD